MIVWILTALDLIVFFMVTIAHFGSPVPMSFLLYCAGYLVLKFALFKDVMSGIDAIFGIYVILLAVFGISGFFYYFFLAWFLYKFISLIPALL